MNSKIVEIAHPFRKKERRQSKEKDEKNGGSLFLSVFYFFPSWPATTFDLNSMRLKLEILFRQLTQFEIEENKF